MTADQLLLKALLERLIRLESKLSRLMAAQGVPVQNPTNPPKEN